MSDNIVQNWLKSIDLEKYSQAFLDNGYDDLEICKQVGEPDLDAIGVDSEDDRKKILEAVKTLAKKGGISVYLTLENESDDAASKNSSERVPARPTLDNLLSDVPPPSPSPAPGPGQLSCTALVSYPKLELTIMLRDKLLEDQIDLANHPYTDQDMSPCWSSLTALAVKYTEELGTYVEDVLDRLEDLRWWRLTEDTNSVYSPPSLSEDPYNVSLYSYSPRGGPPPIPTIPPPDGSHSLSLENNDSSSQMQSVHTRYHDNPSQANYVALETESDMSTEKKKTSTLGRLFRNMGFRKSSRKHSYKKHQGDLLAHEITMGDNDRIALMQMVKEGKISTDTALQVVKRFEEERRKDDPHVVVEKEKDKKSKKANSVKPTKSPSLIYNDESRCEICNTVMTNNYPAPTPGGHQWRGYHSDYCRHRRVHSVSHIAYPDPLRSPGTVRAMSCSPMRSHSAQSSAVNSPVSYAAANQGSKIYTPVIPHELKMYSGSRGLYAVHGIDVLRDRLNVIKTSACVHKTQSKASLISSESDHSMDCMSHLAGQTDQVADETYFCSNNSTVSMGSDTAPGVNGRRKCGSTMEKLRTYKWQRTGSVSQGEDGMSTDNEDLDDPDRLLLGGGTSSSHMMEKFRGVKNEMRRRILHTKDMIGDGKSAHLCSAYQIPSTSYSVSSTDSCSSGHGSQSSHSESQRPPPGADMDGPWTPPIVGYARVHSNYTPPPEEKDFLHLRRGERVQILETSNSGIWKGRIDHRVGFFHFNFVDMVTELTPLVTRKEKPRRQTKRRSKPRSVEELLQRINLEHLVPVFILNGYDNLEIFAEIDHDDLNALSILDSESRTKLLTAAELLMDYEGGGPSVPEEAPLVRDNRSTSVTPTSQQYAVPWTSFFPTKPSAGSRDSGCYDSSEFMNRENSDPYACISRNRGPNNDNKENQRPNSAKKSMKMGVSGGDGVHDHGANGASSVQNGQATQKDINGAKVEKIYSEEDREVCKITGYNGNGVGNSPSAGGTESAGNLTLNIPALGPDWKIYADSASQTSPKYGSLSDSYHSSVDGDINNVNASMSVSAHGDFFSQKMSTLKHKSKPYARRIAPVVPMKDAQVQVMCPLGLFPQQTSPNTLGECLETIPHGYQHTVPQTCSLVLHNGYNQSGQTASLVKTEPVNTARISYVSQTSQNSRDGDSGSDASTVKSDCTDTSGQLGRSTPDALVHKGYKSIKRSVIPKVTSKLASEDIDLAKEPYTTQCGACGIPPLLVQRYAEELKHDLYKTALILDQVRIHKLTTLGRSIVPAEQLTEHSLSTSELKISSIMEFFISIGLPMYADSFTTNCHTSVESIAMLTNKELQTITKADRKHLKRIVHALEWVKSRLTSPSRKPKVSPVKDRV